MSPDHLTKEARLENALMLASVLGLDADSADEALQFDVAVTVDHRDASALTLANELAAILGRTVRNVKLNESCEMASLEVVIGQAKPRSSLQSMFVRVSAEEAVISDDPSSAPCAAVPEILMILVACYLSGAVLKKILGDDFPYGDRFPLHITFGSLRIDQSALAQEVRLGTAYLAGAGAIGNGFLWSLRHLKVCGELHITDDDVVSSGNLNRQIWFGANEIGKPKAERLALLAQPFFPNLKLIPRQHRLQELQEVSDGPWLRRLIVAVDSRRARRALQKEFPGEVFDASTTDIREVVVHYNKQPTDLACMSCIYESDVEEHSREEHIAEHLGVTVAEVRSERITATAADVIVARYPTLTKASLVGLAYDTLFKQLCGQGELKTLEGRRIVAPFAFVSVLAGTLLALELVRRLNGGTSERNFNYWRVSPWYGPILRRQQTRQKQPECEFCGNGTLARVNQMLW